MRLSRLGFYVGSKSASVYSSILVSCGGGGWQKILHTDKNTDDGMSEVIYKFFQFPSL